MVHDHQGLLGGLAAAFAVGHFSLRRAEDFFADLGLGARRALGLGRGIPCDTTLYCLLAGQSPVGFEESVFAVAGHPEADIEEAQQLWYVCQATYGANGAS